MGRKQLGIVKEIVESSGIGISYAYEDLIFLDHNAFLLQFTEKDNVIMVHVNAEAAENEIAYLISLINNAAAARGMKIVRGKYYTLAQTGEENVRLEFVDARV